MNLFVYGTLKSGFSNNVILRRCKLIGEDILDDFEMRSVGWFPAINKKDGGQVKGEVYEINLEILRRTDGLEGFPKHYDRTEITTSLGHTAWVYFYKSLFEELPLVSSGIWSPGDGY